MNTALTIILQCSSTYKAARDARFLFSLNNLPGCFNKKADVAYFTAHVQKTILNNATISTYNNYNQLCFLESLLIKRYIPQLNYGIKASKELVLF